MNIRISGQELRFRISADEHALLLAGKSLSAITTLPDKTEFTYSIAPSKDTDSMQFRNTVQTWTLHVTEQALQLLASPLPKREGLEFTQDINGITLNLSLEVDSKSRHRKHS